MLPPLTTKAQAIEGRCVISRKKRYHTREKGCDTAIADYSFLKIKGWEGLSPSQFPGYGVG